MFPYSYTLGRLNSPKGLKLLWIPKMTLKSARCHHQIRTTKSNQSHQFGLPLMGYKTLLVLFGSILFWLPPIFPPAPPDRQHLHSQHTYHHHRARICAGIYVPSPFLRGPDSNDEDGMQAALPKQIRSGPAEPRIELIMQASSTKHPDGICSKHSRHDPIRLDPVRNLFGLAPVGIGIQE